MCSYLMWENTLIFPPIFFGDIVDATVEEAPVGGIVGVGCFIAGDDISLCFVGLAKFEVLLLFKLLSLRLRKILREFFYTSFTRKEMRIGKQLISGQSTKRELIVLIRIKLSFFSSCY